MAQMRLASILALLACLNVYAKPDKNMIYDTVKFLQPYKSVMDHRKAYILTEFAHKVETNLDLDWKMSIAIIFQESRFQTDPQDCLKIKRICTVDLGIGQINWKLWNKVWKIERLRLASDYEYALHISYKILKHYKEKKGRRKNWHLYYHSGTPSKRSAYRKHLKTHYDKIRVYTRGYSDGQYDTRRIRRINYDKVEQREAIHLSNIEEFIRHLKRRCTPVRPPLQSTCNNYQTSYRRREMGRIPNRNFPYR